MGGWGYILRILKGESPKDVLASMPEKDFDKVSEVGAISRLPISPGNKGGG